MAVLGTFSLANAIEPDSIDSMANFPLRFPDGDRKATRDHECVLGQFALHFFGQVGHQSLCAEYNDARIIG